MERSVYIIKPEAVAHRKRIRSVIREAGLRIVAHKLVVLPIHAIESLYPDMDADLHAATLYYLGVGPSEIGIVEGVDAIKRLNQITGEFVDPRMCASNTIRRSYGFSSPVKWQSAIYFLNGLHRSRDACEVARDLVLFDTLSAIKILPQK